MLLLFAFGSHPMRAHLPTSSPLNVHTLKNTTRRINTTRRLEKEKKRREDARGIMCGQQQECLILMQMHERDRRGAVFSIYFRVLVRTDLERGRRPKKRGSTKRRGRKKKKEACIDDLQLLPLLHEQQMFSEQFQHFDILVPMQQLFVIQQYLPPTHTTHNSKQNMDS